MVSYGHQLKNTNFQRFVNQPGSCFKKKKNLSRLLNTLELTLKAKNMNSLIEHLT